MNIRIGYIAMLAAFAAATAGCGSSSPSAPTPTASADMTINIVGINGSSSFVPSPTTVSVGQRVIWKNVDSRSHDIIQDANSFTTPVIAAGGAAEPVTMSTRGTFTYHCGIHPSMVGTITVQ
jgi:plastocyanin